MAYTYFRRTNLRYSSYRYCRPLRGSSPAWQMCVSRVFYICRLCSLQERSQSSPCLVPRMPGLCSEKTSGIHTLKAVFHFHTMSFFSLLALGMQESFHFSFHVPKIRQNLILNNTALVPSNL